MNLPLDRLYLQSSTLIYFTGWIWLLVTLSIVPARTFAQTMISLFTGVALVTTSAAWCYLTLYIIVDARTVPLRLPLSLELLMIIIVAVNYLPLKPWRHSHPGGIPQYVKVAQMELIGLLLVLPLICLLDTAPFGSDIFGWFPALFEAYTALCLLIVIVSVSVVAFSRSTIRNYLRSAAMILFVLATTYLIMVAALLATI